MERITRIFKRIHITSWVLIFFFFCWVLHTEGHDHWFLSAAGLVGSGIVVFYSHFYILTRFFNRGRILGYFLGLLLILIMGPFVFIWLDVPEITDWYSFREQYFTSLGSFVLIALVLSGIARLTENWFLNAVRKESLEKQAMRAELAYLKAQINPHFLFNTLNNIHALAYKQSPSTTDAIMQLSTLMRYMLYESNADTVPLEREIEYLRNFIGLQQLRYKTTPVVQIDIDGDPATCKVAPLLFIHLLENAYKHSPAQLNAHDIQIKIVVKEGALVFSIRNPIGKASRTIMSEESSGIGLLNVQKRLALLYPDQHTFQVTDAGNTFRVDLKINNLHLRP
jgi:sensor histidine kinase YesM